MAETSLVDWCPIQFWCLRHEKLTATLMALIRDEPAVTQLGIPDGKTELSYDDDTMDVGTCLISEYGELTSLGDIGGSDA